MFYPNPAIQARGSARLAARNVQIIHTSVDEGTFERDGHQDWLMGDCGINQLASPPINHTRSLFQHAADQAPIYIPMTRDNHSTCPWFYISAFEHIFAAVENQCCPHSHRDAWPDNYRMGYMQPNKRYICTIYTNIWNLLKLMFCIVLYSLVQAKTLFARTYKHPPYNIPRKE